MTNILYVTGSRADFGIIENLLKQLDASDEFKVDVVATGMQVEERFGRTVRFVKQSGLNVIAEIPMNLTDSEPKTSLNGLSLLTSGLENIFENGDYDLVIILGDRYEMLAVANAATLYRVPIVHLHGGEQTLGNFDEAIRHSITKLSHLHLTSTDVYRRRVIQMGEMPDRVFNIGSLGVENVLTEPQMTTAEISNKYDFTLHDKQYLIVLFHPETFLSNEEIERQTRELRVALKVFGMDAIIIGSNVDSGSDILAKEMSKLKDDADINTLFVQSLQPIEYHSLVRGAYALVGNSSSGLIEVPSLNTPTINLGNRQLGRTAGPSVIQVPVITTDNILSALDNAGEITDFENPYYQNNATSHAAELIKKFSEDNPGVVKPFYDLPGMEEF